MVEKFHDLKALKASLQKIRHTDPFRAYDFAVQAEKEWPEEVFFAHIQAHSLAQTASPHRAVELLAALRAAGHHDPETLGLLGRAWKDIARDALSEEEQRDALTQAFDVYREGLDHAEQAADCGGYYPGINAAAVGLLLGFNHEAFSLARRAAVLAEKVPIPDYWSIATLGEAALILGDLDGARACYLAAQQHPHDAGQRASTRRQARLIASHLHGDSTLLDDCFHIPPVLVFAGHLTDAADRLTPRFPESMVDAVDSNLRSALARLQPTIGFASAARGGDLLFIEALQERGADVRVILPLELDVFRAVSVTGGAPYWDKRFEAALHDLPVTIANNHSSAADGIAFEYGTRILIGHARLCARQLDTPLHVIALWDGKVGDGHGGTAWAIAHLLRCGASVENIYPGREGPIEEVPAASPIPRGDGRRIHAMLFSDCKGYSKLREEQIGLYTQQFLAGVARLIDHLRETHQAAPIVANTWGDGLFLVFEDVRAAGCFALALRDGIRRRAAALGLPPEIRVRIGLHAGPVLPFVDPVTGRDNFAGGNVAFAARIEPIAAENQVCVSEPFAALAADAGLDEFQFDYLGVTAFAKGFGAFPLYQLRETHGFVNVEDPR
jgi:class 3 adenylate cyclase